MIIDIDTHEALIEFYNACKAKQACEPPMIITEQAISEGWTLRQLIDSTANNPDYAMWARWLRLNLYKELPKELKDTLTYSSIESSSWANQLENLSDKSVVERNLIRNKKAEEWQ